MDFHHEMSRIITIQSSVISHQSSIINHQSSIISHQSSIISHQSSIISHRSSIINHQSSVIKVAICNKINKINKINNNNTIHINQSVLDNGMTKESLTLILQQEEITHTAKRVAERTNFLLVQRSGNVMHQNALIYVISVFHYRLVIGTGIPMRER